MSRHEEVNQVGRKRERFPSIQKTAKEKVPGVNIPDTNPEREQ